ncbi:putative ribonucleoside-diphosphate reductase protein beta subunit [Sinorhizobium phage phiM9]|uniref:ribonucleoside-diphosphate reductase n=1 Tax=Sinorhizobium phage phiM9 TaxID=1636182 RepID=A0A0F6TGK5_9CAUD|nr:putative ribonucleoside-diphosphate reductase protein beta subunit [Sinorhizobium phage phiM9]AKE44661.1 putative ribonucleoside-diphosphate reductase protein beta subunit [Sinorhizobium phage phiM9]
MTPRIFDEVTARKPVTYPETTEFMEAIWTGFWTPMEFDFSTDYHDYHVNMTDQERTIITRNVSAIGQIEIAVKTFWAKVGENLPHPCISDVGFTLAQSEVIHNRAYEKLLEKLGLEEIFEENLKVPVVINRVKYLKKHNKTFSEERKAQYVYSLILFTLFIENVSLFSQFYTVTWFNRAKNILKDTAQQVEYTRNEEMLHANFGIFLINKIKEEYPELFDEKLIEKIKEETLVAYKSEAAIIDWIIGDYDAADPKDPNVRLSSDVLKSYIQKRIDMSLERIGFDAVFKDDPLRALDEQHFWMMEEELANDRVDFFDKKSKAYSKKNKAYPIDTPIL